MGAVSLPGWGVESSEESLDFSTLVAEPLLGRGDPRGVSLDYFPRNTHQKEMLPAASEPAFDGRGSPVPKYEKEVKFGRDETGLSADVANGCRCATSLHGCGM